MEFVNSTKYAIFWLCLYFSVSPAVHAKDNYVPAKLIESVAPKHPYEAYQTRDADSGMVELVFVVNELGEVVHPAVVRSTLRSFENQALIAIQKYRYEAASLNGKPVASRQRLYMEFYHSLIANRTGFTNPMDAPEGYQSLYNSLMKQLNKKEPNERKARHTIKKMRQLAYKTFFTGVHNELASYRFYEVFGSRKFQIEPLQQLLMFKDVEWGGNRALDAEILKTLQLGLIQRQLEVGAYAEVLANYREMSPNDDDFITAFSEAASKIQEIRSGNSVIERKITVPSRGYSFLQLLKRSFLLEVTSGEISNFILRCDARYQVFEFKADAQYQLPDSWGECEIQIVGTPDSGISVLQQ